MTGISQDLRTALLASSPIWPCRNSHEADCDNSNQIRMLHKIRKTTHQGLASRSWQKSSQTILACRTAVEAEFVRNKRIGDATGCWKAGMLVEDDNGSVKKALEVSSEPDS